MVLLIPMQPRAAIAGGTVWLVKPCLCSGRRKHTCVEHAPAVKARHALVHCNSMTETDFRDSLGCWQVREAISITPIT